MSFLMNQKKLKKSNPGSLREALAHLPSSDGVGTRYTLRALSFDRVSRVGLFLFVRVRLAPWGGVGKVVINNYYVSLRVTWG